MKNDSTTTFLNFVLAALVILGVLFALLDIWRTRDLRHEQTQLQLHLQKYQFSSMKLQSLVNDAIAFNSKAPNAELTQLLQNIQAPTAPAK